jgi:hypothetical protein
LPEPLEIVMDGRKGRAVVRKRVASVLIREEPEKDYLK